MINFDQAVDDFMREVDVALVKIPFPGDSEDIIEDMFREHHRLREAERRRLLVKFAKRMHRTS